MHYGPDAKDPFSMVYDGLWQLIERNEKLRNHIPDGNRIKYNVDSEPKEELSSNDVPELALLMTGGSGGGQNSSTSVLITKSYLWTLNTGDLKSSGFHWIEFELFRSLIDYQCILCKLAWCGCEGFVTDLRMTGSEIGTLMSELNRDIEGWSAMLSIEVDMTFSKQALKLTFPEA